MKPRISNTVIYNDPEVERRHAAIITGVMSDTIVNLVIFKDNGVVLAKHSVEGGTGPGRWTWPISETTETPAQ